MIKLYIKWGPYRLKNLFWLSSPWLYNIHIPFITEFCVLGYIAEG